MTKHSKTDHSVWSKVVFLSCSSSLIRLYHEMCHFLTQNETQKEREREKATNMKAYQKRTKKQIATGHQLYGHTPNSTTFENRDWPSSKLLTTNVLSTFAIDYLVIHRQISYIDTGSNHHSVFSWSFQYVDQQRGQTRAIDFLSQCLS